MQGSRSLGGLVGWSSTFRPHPDQERMCMELGIQSKCILQFTIYQDPFLQENRRRNQPFCNTALLEASLRCVMCLLGNNFDYMSIQKNKSENPTGCGRKKEARWDVQWSHLRFTCEIPTEAPWKAEGRMESISPCSDHLIISSTPKYTVNR